MNSYAILLTVSQTTQNNLSLAFYPVLRYFVYKARSFVLQISSGSFFGYV